MLYKGIRFVFLFHRSCDTFGSKVLEVGIYIYIWSPWASVDDETKRCGFECDNDYHSKILPTGVVKLAFHVYVKLELDDALALLYYPQCTE